MTSDPFIRCDVLSFGLKKCRRASRQALFSFFILHDGQVNFHAIMVKYEWGQGKKSTWGEVLLQR